MDKYVFEIICHLLDMLFSLTWIVYEKNTREILTFLEHLYKF